MLLRHGSSCAAGQPDVTGAAARPWLEWPGWFKAVQGQRVLVSSCLRACRCSAAYRVPLPAAPHARRPQPCLNTSTPPHRERGARALEERLGLKKASSASSVPTAVPIDATAEPASSVGDSASVAAAPNAAKSPGPAGSKPASPGPAPTAAPAAASESDLEAGLADGDK